MAEMNYTVPDMSCGHCTTAVKSELALVPGVREVTVDLDTKRVVVRAEDLDDARLKEAIAEAGHEAS